MNKSKRSIGFKTNFTTSVALPSLIIIIAISLFCVFFSKDTEQALNIVKEIMFKNLSWLYVLLVTVFVLFLITLAISKFGKIKLGADDSEPEYSFFRG